MRADAIGLFWEDHPRKPGDRIARVMPDIPETGWTPPTEFPNLAAAKALTIDVETYDPELKKNGPGWARGVGHIVGIAAGVPEGQRWYFPMRHEVQKELNIDAEHVLAWARDNFQNPAQPKVGANLPYDVGWLREEGVFVKGQLVDVQFAEALLRESATVNLDDLGERYLGYGKSTNLLYEWCANYYGGAPTQKQRLNIYRAPPSLVGPYAEGDVDLPFHIIDRQWPLLTEQGLLDIFDMECRLIYLMVEMRYKGVRIDLDVAEQLRYRMIDELKVIDKRLKDLVGFDVNTNANESLARAFEACGIQYPYTAPSKSYPQGQPSFQKGWLKKLDHDLPKLVLKKRAREKLKSTFIESYLLESHVNGIVHGQFHQLRSDDGGARSGRYSSSTPNLQNIPIRSELGKLIRTAFVPHSGHRRWIKTDYSQIEYRGLAHYAVGPGSEEVRARYRNDPTTDFHKMVQGLIFSITGLLGKEDDRPVVKNVNFGTVYGMGEPGLAKYVNLPLAKAKELFEAIHRSAPFLKDTMNATMNEADTLGYITTVLGRRSRFDMWVPGRYREEAVPLPYDKALLLYANPKRAYLHKALNRRLQGSAADLIKRAMLLCWEWGLFDRIGVPTLTVHDELDFSDPGGCEDDLAKIQWTMENAITTFKVPIKVDTEIGSSWGSVEKTA